MELRNQEYAGFFIRLVASVFDTVIILMIIIPILSTIYGDILWDNEKYILGFWDVIISYLFPAIAVISFWVYRSATPGKIILDLTVVDAETGSKPTVKQSVIRYLGYYLASLPLFIGIIWVAFDPKKQGWHDKLAGTVVLFENKHGIKADKNN